MPGVLLIESMAQASGWLIIARTRFETMPFLAAVKEAKLRTFVTPGQALTVSAKITHEGSGFAMTEAEVTVDGKTVCNADITFRVVRFPEGRVPRQHARGRQAHRVPDGGGGPWLTRAPRGLDHRHRHRLLPRRGAGRALAGARRRPAAGRRRRPIAPYIIHQLAPLDFDKQIPKKGDQRQMEPWQRIGTYAAGLALDSAGIKGNADMLARTDMIVAAGGGERDIAADTAILSGLPTAREAGRLPQRTADERSAPDAVPRAAFQPARRQHLDRARRHRLVAHLHGRGSRRRRRGAHRASRASPRARATSRWSAAATTPSGPTC